MMSEASEIDWSDVSQGFPAFMIVAGVPFTYSISAGIGLGFIAYVIVALFKGRGLQDQAAHVDRSSRLPRLLLRSVTA